MVVSIGSSGSEMGGPAVVTEPEVEASVVEGVELESPPGIVVDGRLVRVFPGSTIQVGGIHSELGICTSETAESAGSSWVSSGASVRSTLLASPSVASVFDGAIVGADVDTGTADVIGAGADCWLVSSSGTRSTDSVVEDVLVDGGSVTAIDEIPPTVGPLGLPVPTRTSFFCTSSAWNARGPAIAATDSVDSTTARASREGRESEESDSRMRSVQSGVGGYVRRAGLRT